MTVEELISKYKKGKLFSFSGMATISEVIKDLEQLSIIEHNQKVKIPDFVAEWIEKFKDSDSNVWHCLKAIGDNDAPLSNWVWAADNVDKLAKAWVDDDYEVEKEPKYITNLVTTAGHKWLLARTEAGNIVLEKVSLTTFKEKYNTGRYFLTKDEIRTIDQGNKLLDNFSVKVEKEVSE